METTLWKNDMTSLNWDRLTEAGLPNKGTKFPTHASGTWIVDGFCLVLHAGGRMWNTGRPRLVKRLFVACKCGREIEAGHYGQHYRTCEAAQPREVLSAWTQELLKFLNITDWAGIDEPVFEDDLSKNSFYIKFMSDHGKRDDEIGLRFKSWLDGQGIPYESSRPRSYIVKDALRIYNVIGELPIEDEPS